MPNKRLPHVERRRLPGQSQRADVETIILAGEPTLALNVVGSPGSGGAKITRGSETRCPSFSSANLLGLSPAGRRRRPKIGHLAHSLVAEHLELAMAVDRRTLRPTPFGN